MGLKVALPMRLPRTLRHPGTPATAPAVAPAAAPAASAAPGSGGSNAIPAALGAVIDTRSSCWNSRGSCSSQEPGHRPASAYAASTGIRFPRPREPRSVATPVARTAHWDLVSRCGSWAPVSLRDAAPAAVPAAPSALVAPDSHAPASFPIDSHGFYGPWIHGTFRGSKCGSRRS